MKLFKKFLISSLLLALLTTYGCNKKALGYKSPSAEVGKASLKTGWAYNNPSEGFFDVHTDYYGKCPQGMVYIKVATTVRGQNSDMLSVTKNNAKKRVAASAFYMDEYEVTNLEWREYVRWLQGVYSHRPDVVVRALPDETVWRKELAYNEPYVREYYVSPAYNDYPVVGVSWVQATEYCKWRTDRINELELIYAGVIPYVPLAVVNQKIQENPDSVVNYLFTTKDVRKYVNFVNANFEDFESEDGEALDFEPNYKKYDLNGDGEIAANEWSVALEGALYDSECRLPTEMEWEYAAYGLETDRAIYEQTNTYPWAGSQLRSFEKENEGGFVANFLRGRGDPIGVQLNGTLTMPVWSFKPNSYGLYNMAGNVNEWVKDVFRANVSNNEEINTFRGNEFESDSIFAEEILNKHFAYLDPAKRDSMRVVLIKERGITKAGGDYRNFKDGDMQSALESDSAKIELVYKDLTPIEQANMISNTARVYKGGGWNDRAIWLNPSQRRWLDEKACRNDIGFRCVMSTVGGFEQQREYEKY